MPAWNYSNGIRSNADARTSNVLHTTDHCHCGNQDNTAPQEILAMVYAPRQSFIKIFDPEAALCHGTIFEELSKPFAPCN